MMDRYRFEGKTRYAGAMIFGLAPGYEIIDAQRGYERPIAETDSIDDAIMIVEALNARSSDTQQRLLGGAVDSVDR